MKTKKASEKGMSFGPSYLDRGVRPGDDFFTYAVGGWLKKNPIPKTETRWGSFDVLRQLSRQQIRDIAEELAKKKHKKGSDEQFVADLWRASMDEKRREKLGLSPIKSVLAKIDVIKDANDVLSFIAYAHKVGYDVTFASYVGRDDKDSSRNVFHMAQAGISLPDRDYYLRDDANSKKVRTQYRIHIRKIAALVGMTGTEGKKMEEIVMRVETELAKASMTAVEKRDPYKLYNKRTLRTMEKESPEIDWSRYFKLIGISTPKEFIVYQPLFTKRVSALTKELSIEDWKTYFRWSVIDGSASMLTKKLVRENFRFYGQELTGAKEMQPLWKKSTAVVDGSVPYALGKIYVKKHFDKVASKRINELVDNLFIAYREQIKNLDWMSTTTKKKALIKLGQMKRKLGHPKKWKTYRGLSVEATDFVGNVFRSHEFEWKRMLRRLKEKPDSTEWHMSAPTVNAYFSPNENEIVFPAGIMQSPFFDARADDALNYGGIGAVIGHEITHGFDDEGSKFDGKGNLKNWWTKEDRKRFEKKAQVIVDQFNGFVAIDGIHVNGSLTLGENIADLGGIVIAYKAFQISQKKNPGKSIDGFTPEQRFFFGLATSECGHIRPELLKQRLVTDPHSPAIFRVNGPFRNVPEFYEAFGIKAGDKLYLEPADRAKIW